MSRTETNWREEDPDDGYFTLTSFFHNRILNADAYPDPENVVEIESSYEVRYSRAWSWQCDGSNEQGYENYVRQSGCNLKIKQF